MKETTPPHSIEAEVAVLGAMIRDEEALGDALEMLAPEDFYKPAHRHVFQAMAALFNQSEPVDIATLTNQLEKAGRLKTCGGRTPLIDLSEAVYTGASVKTHAKIVRDKAILRRLLSMGRQIEQRCLNAPGDVADVIDEVESKMMDVWKRHAPSSSVAVADIVTKTLENIDQYKSHSGNNTIPTGFTRLDEMTMGLRQSDLVILAGRPSMGKTAFALNIVEELAVRQRVPCAVFSLEMDQEQLVERMVCSHGLIDSQQMRKGRLSTADYQRVVDAARTISAAPIYIDDSSQTSVLELRSRARRMKAMYGIRLVVVDYLQLMNGPSGAENRQQEIAAISRSLKSLAKELSIPVLALSQLSRQVEQRGGDHRPQLSDLRESGAIEQDADVVLFVYRPERYDLNADSEAAEVIVAKQRNGPTGTVKLRFKKEYTRFEDQGQPTCATAVSTV